jgi:SSS family solute:Na+ symporter
VLIVGVLVYVLGQLALGLWVARRVRSQDDFLLAGRSLGYTLATFTIFATWFGAETCIGAAGQIAAHGLGGASADPFGYALCLLLMGALFAATLWRRKLATIADLMAQRYGTAVERVTVLIVAPTSFLWAGAQIRAFGQVLSASTGLHLELALALAAGTVVAYAAAGGLMASVITDLVQGIALVIGLVLLGWAVVDAAGGLGPALAAVAPEQMSFQTGSASLLETLDAWAIPVFGSLAAQELIVRVLACRSPEVARRATLLGGGLYLLVGLIPVLIGLVGLSLVGPLEHPEQVLPAVAAKLLGPPAYVLFIGALISAILSTVDGALLAVSSVVARNLIEPLNPGLTDARRLQISRLCTLAFGVLAYLVGRSADGVHDLVEDASGFSGGGLIVVFAFALWTRFGGPRSALAALLVGIALWLLGRYAGLTPAPFLTSMLAAFVVYVVVALAERLRLLR